MTNSSKIRAVAAAAGACVALFASMPANAFVYAVSKLQIKDLDIGVFRAGTTTPDVGAATNYSFNLTNTAQYTPPVGPAVGALGVGGCSGNASPPASTNCSTITPVLNAPVANAPSLLSARADNDFSILGHSGALTGASYSNADSQVTTAKLVQGGTTSTVQIAESLLNINGAANANTEVKSNTTLAVSINLTSGADLYLSFKALLDLKGEISDMLGGFYTADAKSNVTMTLSKNGTSPSQFWVWTPDGNGGHGCDTFNAIAGSSCVETADGWNLNGGDSKTGNPDSFDFSSGSFKDFGVKILGLTAGTYSLTLVANTTTYVDRTYVPEPGSLALVGLALAGLGFAGKRRSRK